IGTTGLHWSIWKDVLAITDLGLRLSVVDPLHVAGGGPIGVGVWGKLLVENTPLTVSAATAGEALMLAAALVGGATLALQGVMKTYAPALPAPADLTVNRLLVSYSTGVGGALQFGASLAQAPQAWTLALGPVPLALENVVFDLSVPDSGSTTGSFRGDILL